MKKLFFLSLLLFSFNVFSQEMIQPNQAKFNKLITLTHQSICGTGKITEYKRQYQMMLDDPENLMIMGEK